MGMQFYSFSGVAVKMDKKCIAIFVLSPGSSNCGMRKKSRMVISIKQMLPQKPIYLY